MAAEVRLDLGRGLHGHVHALLAGRAHAIVLFVASALCAFLYKKTLGKGVDLAMPKIEVVVRRLGGVVLDWACAFDWPWALIALIAWVLKAQSGPLVRGPVR